jgi:hypothetical protein
MRTLIPVERIPRPKWSRRMTTCVAVICDDGNAIVLVADKLIGIGYVESELEITKMRHIHHNWWVLFAGDDITPVFDIVDYARAGIGPTKTASIADVQEAIGIAFARKRMEEAEALYLAPIGWDIVRRHPGSRRSTPPQSCTFATGLPISPADNSRPPARPRQSARPGDAQSPRTLAKGAAPASSRRNGKAANRSRSTRKTELVTITSG